MQIVLIIFLVIWGIGIERLGRKYSNHTLSSLLGFSPAETSFKGYFYMVVWTVVLLLLFGVVLLFAGVI